MLETPHLLTSFTLDALAGSRIRVADQNVYTVVHLNAVQGPGTFAEVVGRM